MNDTITPFFRPYRAADWAACLALFDANCPQFFAVNERGDFMQYLQSQSRDYQVAEDGGPLIAAFGFSVSGNRGRINWIMAAPQAAGRGIGRQMMSQALGTAERAGVVGIDIAASHLSESFFSRFGARVLDRTENGWGPQMHRVDMELNLPVSL